MAVAGGERFGELAADQLGVAFAVGERQAARQQLEGGDPEAEDVGGHSHRFTPQQFGCGVGGGGHHGVVDVCGGQGDTEVGEVGGSLFVEQQVGGANVAVDDTFATRATPTAPSPKPTEATTNTTPHTPTPIRPEIQMAERTRTAGRRSPCGVPFGRSPADRIATPTDERIYPGTTDT
jgi:hypothetical protein